MPEAIEWTTRFLKVLAKVSASFARSFEASDFAPENLFRPGGRARD